LRKHGNRMITWGGQAAAAGSPPIRPSRQWYWVAGGALAAALICSALAVAGFFSLNRQIKDFQRVAVPGQAEVTFAQPGGYILYLERPGRCCSLAAGSGDSAPFSSWSVNVALLPDSGGPPVAITIWRGATESYGVAGHEGQTAMHFTIGHPGRYLLVAQNAIPRSITDVAVGRGIGRGMLWVLLILVALFALIPAGLVIGGVTFFRRRRARRNPLQAPQVMQPNENSRYTMSTPDPTRAYPSQPDDDSGYAISTPDPVQAYPSQPGRYPSGGRLAAPLSYLQGGPVGFGEAIKQGFSNAFVYRGRASRSAYWWFNLFVLIAVFAVEAIIFIPLTMNSSGASIAVIAISAIVVIYLDLVLLALLVRRLHDIDKSGWWVFIGLVPFAGPIVLFVFTVLAGTPELNRYQP
jgi:uncharacterized membrane protein YhaH (DUF805 family)